MSRGLVPAVVWVSEERLAAWQAEEAASVAETLGMTDEWSGFPSTSDPPAGPFNPKAGK